MIGDEKDKVIGSGYGENPYENKQFQFDPRQDGIKAADACMERVRNTAGKYYPLSIKVINNGWMVSDQWGRETAFLKKEDLIRFIVEWCGE